MAGRDHQPGGQIDAMAADRLLRLLDVSSLDEVLAETAAIGPYRLEQQLGRGGGGVVYRAWRDGSDRPVALKLLRAGVDEGWTARIRREIDLLEEVRLDCVPRILDFGSWNGQQYLVTELVDGVDVKQAAAPLDRRGRAQLMCEVCQAVQQLHEHGLIHRDLKPSNVLVTERGVFIIDFGLAAMTGASGQVTITTTGALIGTPQYMAPEQARGESGRMGVRSDVYSLGCMLCELLTGHTPHDESAELPELIRSVGQDPPRSARSLDPTLPAALRAVIDRAVAPMPERRYASAAALADDLQRWLRGDPIHVRPISSWTRMVWLMRRRPGTAVLLLLLGAVVGLGGWQGVLLVMAARKPPVIDLRHTPAALALVGDYPHSSLGESVAAARAGDSGHAIVVSGVPGRPGMATTPWIQHAGGVAAAGETGEQEMVDGTIWNGALGGAMAAYGDIVAVAGTGEHLARGSAAQGGVPHVSVFRIGTDGAMTRLGQVSLPVSDGRRLNVRWLRGVQGGSKVHLWIGAPHAGAGLGWLVPLDALRSMHGDMQIQQITGAALLSGDALGDGFGADACVLQGSGGPVLAVGQGGYGVDTADPVGVKLLAWRGDVETPRHIGHIRGTGPKQFAELSIESIGDIDHDGAEDLAIGTNGIADPRGDGGRVWLISGAGGWQIDGVLDDSFDRVIARFVGPPAVIGSGDHLGHVVRLAGDFNGDGLNDIAIGAPRSNPNGNDSGCVYVVHGRRGGWPDSPVVLSPAGWWGGVVIRGAENGDQTGISVERLDPATGAGQSRLLIGAPGGDRGGSTDGGQVWVVEGGR